MAAAGASEGVTLLSDSAHERIRTMATTHNLDIPTTEEFVGDLMKILRGQTNQATTVTLIVDGMKAVEELATLNRTLKGAAKQNLLVDLINATFDIVTSTIDRRGPMETLRDLTIAILPHVVHAVIAASKNPACVQCQLRKRGFCGCGGSSRRRPAAATAVTPTPVADAPAAASDAAAAAAASAPATA